MAAVVLARTGARVLVVDRARFPRHKLCGDTLNPGALALLAHVGLGAVADTGVPLDGMMVTGPWVPASSVATAGALPAGRCHGPCWMRVSWTRPCAPVPRSARAWVVEPLYDESGPRTQVRGAVLDVEGRRVRIPALVTIAADGRRSALGLHDRAVRHPPAAAALGRRGVYADVAALQSRGEMHIRQGAASGTRRCRTASPTCASSAPCAKASTRPRACRPSRLTGNCASASRRRGACRR